ncbi:glycosyltransferase [bacterium]|nr:glycosyltransferase [candidate division CSSED10-310 bacterium]
MPNILFIARAFPPAPVIASVRCWNIAEQMRKFGWTVTVVTIDTQYWLRCSDEDIARSDRLIEKAGIIVIRTAHDFRSLPGAMHRAGYERHPVVARGIRKAAHWLGIDSGAGWMRYLRKTIGADLMRHVDLIVADGSPFSVFRFTRRLSEKYGVPYILDFRDLWHKNPLRGRRSRPWEIIEERRCVKSASSIITVSDSTARVLREIHGSNPDIRVITNGFAPSDFTDLLSMSLPPCALVYAGSIYPPKITLTPILKSMAYLKRMDNKTPVELHLFGKMGAEVKEEAMLWGVESMVIDHGHVSRSEALAAFRAARMGVVVTSIESQAQRADNGILTGKLFEILGAGTPVLLIAPQDSDAAALVRNRGIGEQFTGDEVERIAVYLAEEMKTPKNFNTSEAVRFSWDTLGIDLNRILTQTLERDSGDQQSK